MRQTYRDARGRFTTPPPPPPVAPVRRPTPPRWVDGRFASREKFAAKAQQETAFTGKEAVKAYVFPTAQAASRAVTAASTGALGAFLAAAYTEVTVRPESQGWQVRIYYRYPNAGEISP